MIIDNKQALKAPIFGISRHRLTTDGRGVTTLVTFYGCTLKCKFCLNPQCFGAADKMPIFTPQLLLDEVKKDDLYFRATGGGITFGGGEPCLRAEFIAAFRELCPLEWKIRLESALNVQPEIIERLVSYVDEWIVDIKSLNPEIFKFYTGFDIALRNESLARLSKLVSPEKVKLRVPIIPGFTTIDDAIESREYLKTLGFSSFEIFQYVTQEPVHYGSLIPELPSGKAKCEVMKRIRFIIADANEIKMQNRACSHKGDCAGVCPSCDNELLELTQIINKKIYHNQPILLISDLEKLIRQLREEHAEKHHNHQKEINRNLDVMDDNFLQDTLHGRPLAGYPARKEDKKRFSLRRYFRSFFEKDDRFEKDDNEDFEF